MEVIVQALTWWSELWYAKDNWVGRDILKIEYQFIDIVQWKFSTDWKHLPQSNVEVIVLTEMHKAPSFVKFPAPDTKNISMG